ncbi:Long-chain-fatty-acid--CoA ligase [Giardia duodenalis]|uniref:Long-chain-fatty-acid--CoA ligase n=1 Tax=Giardia intestinalis TaxID=5741 RepID=V6TYL4_GIAIN|nr:Long-chain-fatty-acid--CoA ligase [Giardia intestinalis]
MAFLVPFEAPDFIVDDSIATISRLFCQRALQTPRRRCLGTREFLARDDESPEARGDYEWYSYLDVLRMASELFYGLQAIGLKQGDHVGIMSANRVEWALVDLACGALGAITVPIYDTIALADIIFIANDSQITTLFLTLNTLQVWSAAAPSCPTVKTVVLFDDRYDDRWFIHKAWAHATGIKHPPLTSVPFVYKSFEDCDDGDRKEGIANERDLTPAERAHEAGTKMRYPRRLVCTSIPLEKVEDSSTCQYTYLPSLEVSHDLDKTGSPTNVLHLVSYTLHGVMAYGRKTPAYHNIDFRRAYLSPDTLTTPIYSLDIAGPDTLMTLVYTSGTTGNPKGVKLTQGNVLWTSASMAEHRVEKRQNAQEFNLSYLPNAHIYQRVIQGVMWYCNGATGFWCGSIKGLSSDIQTLRPTIFIAVPRILNRVFEGIMNNIEKLSVFRRFLFFLMFSIRRKAMRRNTSWPKWTNLFFSATKALLGGRCCLCVTGSAPLSQKVGEFLYIACDTRVIEGWGMTETAAHGTVQPMDTKHWGYVGCALDSSTKIRLNSVPDMDYLVTDKPNPRGEVWIKGPSVFSGYYNDDAKTKETLTEDGWFMTGDIGEYDRSLGELRLIDRKGCIFKLSQGEFICTTTIENTLFQSKLIDQCLVYGDRLQSYLLTVIVPNFAELRATLAAASGAANNLIHLSDRELAVKEAAIIAVLREVEQTCAAHQLRPYEIPRAVILEHQPWTQDNESLTPALKIRRTKLISRYRPYLGSLYHHINKISSHKPSMQQIALTVIKVIDGATLSEVSTQITGASGLSGMSHQ